MDTKEEEAWRAELKQNGLENVKLKLSRTSIARDTLVRGFKDSTCEIPRGFCEDWVAEEEKKAAKERRQTLCWAIVAGVTGFLALVATLVGLFIQLAL
jgi:hypothetical protein